MIFLRKEPLREYVRRYPVTTLLLVLQIVLFIIMEIVGSTKEAATLLDFGALFRDPQHAPEWWRYVASIFLHSGVEHLLFNSFALFVFAPPLERLLGSARYFLFYIVAGVIGNVVTDWVKTEPYVAIGASGAIFGVYGAYCYIALFRPAVLDKQSKQTALMIVVIGVIYSFIAPHVNIAAHLGGFAGGVLLAALFALRPLRSLD